MLIEITKQATRLRQRCCVISYNRAFTSSASSSEDGNEKYKNDPQSIKEDNTYCVNLVKDRDGEGYLCGLLMPASIRQSYFALRAFNVEIASIKDTYNVRNSGLPSSTGTVDYSSSFGLQMRIQWWKDAIDKIYNKVGTINKTNIDNNNTAIHDDDNQQYTNTSSGSSAEYISISTSCWNSPIIRSLDRTIQKSYEAHHRLLTKRFLEQLIEARELDLQISQYNTVDDLVSYCEDTVSTLLYLSLELSGIQNDEADSVAYHAGVGIGLTTALRSTPFRLTFGEVPIPGELFRPNFPYGQLVHDHYYKQNEDSITLTESDAILFHEAIQYITQLAIEHLSTARQHQSFIPSRGKPAVLLPIIPSLHYLQKLQEVNYNLFDPAVTDPNSKRLKLLWLLTRTWLTNIV